MDMDEAESVALTAIADKYSLSADAIKQYFVYTADVYTNDPACIRVGILLRTRNHSGAPWDYAAIINLTTAQADDVFAADDLFARLSALAGAWESLRENDAWLDYYRWYTTWNPHGDFGRWPVEAQAAASEAFWVHGQKQREETNGDNAYYPLQMLVNHQYAIPTGHELPEDEAKRLAIQAGAKAVGVDEAEILSWQVERTFSRDDQSVPVWRYLFTGDAVEEGPWHVVVWLDGVTGEIIHAGDISPAGGKWFTDAAVL